MELVINTKNAELAELAIMELVVALNNGIEKNGDVHTLEKAVDRLCLLSTKSKEVPVETKGLIARDIDVMLSGILLGLNPNVDSLEEMIYFVCNVIEFHYQDVLLHEETMHFALFTLLTSNENLSLLSVFSFIPCAEGLMVQKYFSEFKDGMFSDIIKA